MIVGCFYQYKFVYEVVWILAYGILFILYSEIINCHLQSSTLIINFIVEHRVIFIATCKVKTESNNLFFVL